jgi:hypothetical protein
MSRSVIPLTLLLGPIALVGCGEDRGPTQPEGAAVPAEATALPAFTPNTWTLKAAPPNFLLVNQASAGAFPDAPATRSSTCSAGAPTTVAAAPVSPPIGSAPTHGQCRASSRGFSCSTPTAWDGSGSCSTSRAARISPAAHSSSIGRCGRMTPPPIRSPRRRLRLYPSPRALPA